MVRKLPRGIRGLRHIKTACGSSHPRAVSTGRRSIIPPETDRQTYSMRSFSPSGGLSGGFGSARQPQSKSPFKARVVAPSLLRVRRFCEPVPELIQDGDSVNVRIPFPPAAADVVQFDVQGDILIVRTETEDTRYHTECLLPFAASLVEHTYSDGALRVILRGQR